MPLLTNIKQRAFTRGAKETYHQNIFDLLEARLGILPENLIQNLKKIEDISLTRKLELTNH